MARREKGGSGPDTSFWMVTFSDLLSLMLTFFVLLLSMSQMEEKRLRDIATSFRGGMGNLGKGGPFGTTLTPKEIVTPPQPQASYRERMDHLKDALRSRFDKMGPKVRIGSESASGALQISLNAEFMFDTGSAQLSDPAKGVLAQIGQALRHIPGRFEIAGHTDDVPIRGGRGRTEDNWALSLARAVSVGGFFVQEMHLESQRLEVAGYGPARPVASNDSEEGRAANRRITIRMLGGSDAE